MHFISTVTLCVAMARTTARKSQSYVEEPMSESDGDEGECTGTLQLYWPREMILLIKTKLRELRNTCDPKTEMAYKHQLGDDLRAEREAALQCSHVLQVGDKIVGTIRPRTGNELGGRELLR